MSEFYFIIKDMHMYLVLVLFHIITLNNFRLKELNKSTFISSNNLILSYILNSMYTARPCQKGTGVMTALFKIWEVLM